jgi:exosome complex RNA-binding protein Rrp4
MFLIDRGHGTYVGEEENVIASVTGTIQRVNKLLSVKSLKSRYVPPTKYRVDILIDTNRKLGT